MKKLPIPFEDQIIAMLNGSIFDLVSQYYGSLSTCNIKKYLTVDRRMIELFLEKNNAVAVKYYESISKSNAFTDHESLWKDAGSGKYFVATMDHGEPRFIRQFNSLHEAIAEHVLLMYGMY